jgi:hypothetical protein
MEQGPRLGRLIERGEHEEAERQRQWPAAKAWLVRFCERHNPRASEDDPYEMPIADEELLELGWEAVEDADEQGREISCGNNMNMCDALRAHRRAFWKNWSVVTGIPVPGHGVDTIHFRCAC